MREVSSFPSRQVCPEFDDRQENNGLFSGFLPAIHFRSVRNSGQGAGGAAGWGLTARLRSRSSRGVNGRPGERGTRCGSATVVSALNSGEFSYDLPNPVKQNRRGAAARPRNGPALLALATRRGRKQPGAVPAAPLRALVPPWECVRWHRRSEAAWARSSHVVAFFSHFRCRPDYRPACARNLGDIFRLYRDFPI